LHACRSTLEDPRTLVEIGLGERHPDEMREILMVRDRSAAGKTAPPHGLCLMQVKYGRRRRSREYGKVQDKSE
jgi:Pseudouridylate synthase